MTPPIPCSGCGEAWPAAALVTVGLATIKADRTPGELEVWGKFCPECMARHHEAQLLNRERGR